MARRDTSGAGRGSMAGPISAQVMVGSGQVFRTKRAANPQTDRNQLCKPWQRDVYRQVNICGEARYSAALFSAIAGRAELGIAEPQALNRKAVWVDSGPEVDALALIAPTARERSKLIRDFMLHWIIAGECYLIARDRVDTDPGYIEPPSQDQIDAIDLMSDEFDDTPSDQEPMWEIVAVTDIQKTGDGRWQVRHDNGNWLDLRADDPIIRLWNPDPENRREAWSPYRSLLPTLREIEWLTAHIFTQVKSRLMSAGVWFLPENLTFPPPPPDAVEGGAEAIAQMNEAQQFAMSLAAASMSLMDPEDVSFPSVVMADPAALQAIDQNKLIKFWSEIDDKAMILRSDAVRRFALGMDLPPEQVLGSSGLAVSNSGGSAGSVNHWGVWANEEQTISAHIEPALDTFTAILTSSFLRTVVEGTKLVIGYDTTTLRLRQDRSKEAMELYDRGLLKAAVTLKEVGFDPLTDMMDEAEHRMWVLNRIVSGQFQPEQMQAALALIGIPLPAALPPVSGNEPGAKDRPGRSQPPSLEGHPHEGAPQVDHEHKPAPFSTLGAAAEAVAFRALEKFGNRLLNDGKRGRDRDRSTPLHLAHVTTDLARTVSSTEFDVSMASLLFADLPVARQRDLTAQIARFCTDLVNSGQPYSREALLASVKGL